MEPSLKTRRSSCTSSSSQDVRSDDPVVGKSYDSSRNPGHTLQLNPTQLNSTRLSGSVAGALGLWSLLATAVELSSALKARLHYKTQLNSTVLADRDLVLQNGRGGGGT